MHRCSSLRLTADRDEGQPVAAGSKLSCGFDRHGDEKSWPNRYGFFVDEGPAIAGDDEVEVLDVVVEVVVENGFCVRRQLDCVDLECFDAEGFAHTLIEWARRGMWARFSSYRRWINDFIGHAD